MTSVRVTHHIGDLAADLRYIARTARGDMRGVVREGIKVGAVVARDYAKESAGEHGKHYPNAITAEMGRDFNGYGTGIIQGEYGPDIAKPQGEMSFEGGSRNQPPHNDLAKSADLIGPAFQGEVSRLPDRWFWPHR
jgi:hypothetical protein